MSVTLISGSSRVARVDLLAGRLLSDNYYDNRPIYFSGLCEPDFPFLSPPDGHSMTDWQDWAPVSSVLIVENAQAFFNPCVKGFPCPPCIRALDTHRHRHVDFFFLVPHAIDLDLYVRVFVSPHYHIFDGFLGPYVKRWHSCFSKYTREGYRQGIRLSYKSCCRVLRSGDK